MIKCTIQPLGTTRPNFCPLPEYCQVEVVEVIVSPLNGDELLELFLTGNVAGKTTITKLVALT